MLDTILSVIAVAQLIVVLGGGVYLFVTRGPKKSFEEELKEMQEDGLKTYRK